MALGHHLDDAVETFYMNLWREGRIGCFSPVTQLDRRGLTLIRPMLLATEHEVRCAVKEEDFPIVKSRCPADGVTVREQTKDFVRERCRTDHASGRKRSMLCRRAASTVGGRSIQDAHPIHPQRRECIMQMQNFEKHVWAEIDLDALRANFRTVKQRAGCLPLCAVVKADSYGHGAVQCARVFAQEGASWLAVSCLAEALQLRRSGQTLPILILGHVQATYAAASSGTISPRPAIPCPRPKPERGRTGRRGPGQVHLAVDTGMGRIGFALRTDFDAAIAEAIAACTLPGLEMTGLFQHFSVADDTAEENIAYTAEQHRLFVQACSALTAAGHEPGIVHCDNSAGVMLHPDWPEGLPRAHCMARPGIILYGFDPAMKSASGCSAR